MPRSIVNYTGMSGNSTTLIFIITKSWNFKVNNGLKRSQSEKKDLWILAGDI